MNWDNTKTAEPLNLFGQQFKNDIQAEENKWPA